MADWSLTSLQLKLIKIGARVVRHARAITFQLAEVAVTGPMVRDILAAIQAQSIRPVSARFQVFSACQFQGMSSSMRLIL